VSLEEHEAIEDVDAFCTWAGAISIRTRVGGKPTRLVPSRLGSSSIEGKVYTDPSESLNRRVPVDIGFGRSLWHTDGTLESATSLHGIFEVRIDLERHRSSKSHEMRSEARWPTWDYAPVFGEIANPFQYDRRTPFRLEDISLSGVKLVIARPMPLMVGITLHAKFNFINLGLLETELLVRGVERQSSEQVAHCEFVQLTENHSRLILSYIDAHSQFDGISQTSASRVMSGFAFLSERGGAVEVILGGKSVASIAVNLVGSNRHSHLELDGSTTASVFLNSPGALAELVGYALRCATIHGVQEIRIHFDHDVPDILAYGFRRSISNVAITYSLPTMALRRPLMVGVRCWLRLSLAAGCWLPTNRNPMPRVVARIATRSYSARHRLDPAPVSWEQYAIHYDTMCRMNPAYQELLAKFESWISSSTAKRVLEIGAGTGNFASLAAQALPNAHITHVDRDNVMNSFAKRKYSKLGLSNIEVVESEIDALNYEPATFDAIVSVHTLYVLPNPAKILQRLQTWLKPDGSLFVIDVGRPINVANWACYIFAASAPKFGLKNTIAEFIKGRQVMKQNRNIRQAQANGTYWTHTLAEFESALKDVGFEVADSGSCYRLMSDYAICIKRTLSDCAAFHNRGHDGKIDEQRDNHDHARTEP